MTATVDDDDQGLTLSASTVSLTEGGSTGSYTVRLAAAPNADVTVAVSSDDTGAVTVSPSSLTFTTTNYASTQTVTLTVVEDADGADESVTVSNTSSGGGYDASGNVTATVDDDDQGLTLSASSVALTEGGSTGSYTVKLAAAPNADVTVAVSSDDTGAVTVSPSSLTFTTTNYSSVQTVTLTAVDDGDGTDESVTVSNTSSGGGYDASGNVTVSVDDDDQGITLSVSSVALTEGGSTGSYTVKLDAAPNANVTVAVSSDDTGAVRASPSTLIFSTTNYATARTVTLTAVGDADGADESVTVSNTASGGGYDASGDVTATVDDDDQGLTVSVSSVALTEGGSTGSYTVRLAAAPNANVTVSVSSDDTGAVTVSPSSLTFTTTNYSSVQTVTLTAVGDADGTDESVTVSNTSSGGGYDASGDVTVTVDDDDQGLTVSASTVALTEGGSTGSYTVRLAAAPNANVTVSVSSDDTGAVTVSPSSLTFTTTNYASTQTVTLTVVNDADGADESVTVSNTSSGGGYDASAGVTVTVDDDDQGLTVSVSSVSLTEGGPTGSYTVKLPAAPNANVTVAVSSDDTGAVRASPSTLTFSTTNYATARTVTLTAVGDADAADESVTVSNTASGGGYDASGNVTATVDDDDQNLTVSVSNVALTEGGSTGSYTVKLAAAPPAAVTVAVASDDTGAVTVSPSSLTFSTTNYASVQTVTLTVVEDADGADESVTVSNSASGAGYDASAGVTATVDDDDQGLTVSVSSVALTEGGSTESYTVKLDAAPNADVTVAVSSDDTGAVTASPSSLTFSTTNYASVQTVTLTAVDDEDGADESVIVSNAASGGGYDASAGVTATVDDDDLVVTPPSAVGTLPALTLVTGGAPHTVDVSDAFSGPDLGYTVGSSHPASVTASIEGALVTLTPHREGEAQVTVTARNRNGEARQSFTATVVTDPAERRAIKDGLAALGRGMLSSADMALGARLRGDRSREGARFAGYELESGGGEAAPGAAQGFSSDTAQGFSPGAGDERPGSGREGEIADLDWLGGTSFVVALNAGADAGEGAGLASRWTLWGQGDVQSFASDRSSVDGETRTAWLGLDAGWGDDWLLGAAVSHGEGHADYAFEGEGGSGSGRLRTTLTSLHPYLRWRPREDGTVWAALGVGKGRVENRRDHLGWVDRGDLWMLTAWGSGRYGLGPAFGAADLALLGDLAVLWMRADSGSRPGSLDDVSSSVGRLRLGLEGSWVVRMETGELSPFARVSNRNDSGDGETGSGIEVSGGVRYRSGRMSFETGGRALWARAGDYEESGWNVALALDPLSGGRGLSLSLSPTWGAAQHRALEALWRPDALSRLDDGAPPAGDGHGMRARIGYGLWWPAPAALLTPYTEHDSFSSGERRTRMGVRMELLPSRVEMDLRGEREEGSGRDAGDTGVFVDVRLRF